MARASWLAGRRALVMGLGTHDGGLGVARYLAHSGAEVTVTDLRGPEALASALEALSGLPLRFTLGEHRAADFERAEIVVRNPAVPLDSPWLALARAHGASIEMEMSLFFRACPAPIVGITGTKGKTTTATLCAGILRQWRPDTVLAGNMGKSALDTLERITPETPVVLELSSWQLEGLVEPGLSPQIAVFTNFSEDHLNRYRSMAEYLNAKLQIARCQGPDDFFVVNRDDPAIWGARGVTRGHVVPFGVDDGEASGAFLSGERLLWRRQGEEAEICRAGELTLPGAHNARNALAAAAAALLRGAAVEDARRGLTGAAPVPHRQERVAEVDGVLYVNDTAATTPAAVFAALDTFRGRPLVVIAGGSDKQVPLEELARRLAAEAAAVVLLQGAATPELAARLDAAGTTVLGPFDSMPRAVGTAAGLARPGEIVLLSPGCASFGMFRDEFHRGEAFREAVGALSPRGEPVR